MIGNISRDGIQLRQAHNGGRYLVGTYDTKEAAQEKITELTRCHHKQTYWVSEAIEAITGYES